MQKCILDGHTPKEMDGAGQYADRKFLVCIECGKVLGRPSPAAQEGRAE